MYTVQYVNKTACYLFKNVLQRYYYPPSVEVIEHFIRSETKVLDVILFI